MHGVVDAVWREQWGRLLALLVAQYRRLDLAEDGLAEAFEAAVRHWPDDGPPASPPAWLLTVARRRILDRLRAEAMAARKEPLLVVDERLRESATRTMADSGDLIEDERLRLIFLCAHPSLSTEAASALTLRLVLGVSTEDVARLFLVSTGTMAARLTRAKRKLAASGAPFRVPEPDDRADRLATVAAVVHLAFTAGYAPGSGPDVVRVELAGEAIRLTRLLRELLPRDEITDVLLALMLLQHSRRDARVGPEGMPVLLPDQDRSRWRHAEIAEGLEVLAPHVSTVPTGQAGIYLLQALIAAEHALAPTSAATRWDRVAGYYAELEALAPSPATRLGRAVAVAEAQGAEAGLAVLDGLETAMPHSHRVPAVRAELLARVGDTDGARNSYDAALALCGNEAERGHLESRRSALGTG